MHLITRNVNTAFLELLESINSGSFHTYTTKSRVGEALVISEPLTLTYKQPCERVLFNSIRDCNPTFHLYEALWMLSGRNDVAPLSYYSSKIGAMASDDGIVFNGAYGYRWRSNEVDQLDVLIKHLRTTPTSRRAVLQMWDVTHDLMRVDSTKDTCCNLCAVFSVVDNKLSMIVYNRSNDIILGMLGANVVHFSFLLEYMSLNLGLQVGEYHQVTCNGHIYKHDLAKVPEWLKDTEFNYTKPMTLVPLIQDCATFDKEVLEFVELNKDGNAVTCNTYWREPFLRAVAQPMCHAFHMHKSRDYMAANEWCGSIAADDWRIAAQQWIAKRQRQWEARKTPEPNFEQQG